MMFDTVLAEGTMDVAMADRLCRLTGKNRSRVDFRDARGGGNFWREAQALNQAAANGLAVFGLADLEQLPCVPHAFRKYLGGPPVAGFCLRLAVPMLESWLMGDAVSLREFFRLPSGVEIPSNPEALKHPKRELLEILRRTQLVDWGGTLAVFDGGIWWPGPEYTSNMKDFIGRAWNARRAATVCPSLSRALAALRKY